jgi:hypothetical protein
MGRQEIRHREITMVALAPMHQSRPRIRDHSRFWLTFMLLILVGLVVVWLTFVTLGVTTAGLVLLAEGAIGLGLGVR